MMIIAILTALTLAAASGVMNAAARGRAKGEIQAMSSALESYKIDNGIYPTNAVLLGGTTGNYSLNPSVAAGTYQQSSQALFEALAGRTNYADTQVGKSYMTFKITQLGNSTTTAGTAYAASTATYIQDPWNYSYGYSTGDGTAVNVPCNGTNFYDLWSTGGLTATTTGNSAPTNTWISNWRSQ